MKNSNMKRMLSVMLAMVMVFAMTMTAFAVDITITGGDSESTYGAYKLLDATDLGNGKYAYTVNETYETILQTATGKTTDEEIVAHINDLDKDAIKTFAESVYQAIKADTSISAIASNGSKFEGVEAGYYLIVETNTGDAQDTYSLVMLDTAGNQNIEVATKESEPTLVKKVQETNDSTGATGWQDAADYDIGDLVPFKLTATLANNVTSYNTYSVTFTDTLDAGLAYDTENAELKVTIDGTDVTGSFAINSTINADGTTTLTVSCTDVKALGATNSSVIVVEYKATLDIDAELGTTGNWNTAKLTYSNNPNADEEGTPDTTGETPEDKVVVFTYKVQVNKVDKDNNALEGAGFTLYKFDKNANDYVAIDDEITGVTSFEWTGLDAGQYKLVETKVPAGYNKADDVVFTVVADYDVTADTPTLKSLIVKDSSNNTISVGDDATFTATASTGLISTDVVNLAGSKLPSTGGIGTTIFYIVGSILVVGAVVVMVTRRRMSA